MSNLLRKAAAPKNVRYQAADIEVLEGLEPVRRRPGMYIGGTDERALHHLAAEVLDNAMDEAVAGHAEAIWVTLHPDHSLTIRDDGRGIPVDEHPKFPGKSALEVIFTTLHSGGKFSGKLYDTSGGLHGVGISVVNALSDRLVVEIVRDKQRWRQEYSRGQPISRLKALGPAAGRTGTSVTFHPDADIFGSDARLQAAPLYRMMRAKAHLHRAVTIHWQCPPDQAGDTVPAKATLHFPGGLADSLQEIVAERGTLTAQPFTGEARLPDQLGKLEWALAWPLDGEGESHSYCNTIPTPQGGTHEAGLRAGLLRGLRRHAELTSNKRAGILTGDDVAGSAVLFLSIFMRDPQFQGQTKEKLASLEAQKLTETVIRDHFEHWLAERPQAATELLQALIERAEARQRAQNDKELARKTATRKLRLPGKLADCAADSRFGTELFLVEGDSAGGSAKQARNRHTQAILPLRGKILNVASASGDKLRANQEIADLALALGCGLGAACDPAKLRYERIIIMTDADVDGAHIASLLMTFFYLEMQPIIRAGHLFLAQPPLYRLSHGSLQAYARDEAHRDQLLATQFKGKKPDLSRFKGLGEMLPAQLRETTMDPARRILLRVVLPDDPNGKGDDTVTAALVEQLMGRKAEGRFDFIQQNALRVRDQIDA